MSPLILSIVVLVAILLGLATWKAPRLTSIVVWSLVATVFFSAALLIAAPGPFKEKALWLTLAVPVIWACFQFWTYWERKRWRVVAGLALVSIVGAVIVFLSEPMI